MAILFALFSMVSFTACSSSDDDDTPASGDIKHMFEQQLTPKDFGLKVRDNCDELQITASNKMRHSYGVDFHLAFIGIDQISSLCNANDLTNAA